MKVNIVEKYTAVVLELKGDILGGPKDAEFGDSLRKLIAEGKKNIIIDLKETGFVNSSGLGMLIGGYTTVKNGGGELKLANATEKIESLLVITKLTSVFTNYTSVEDAVNSFSNWSYIKDGSAEIVCCLSKRFSKKYIYECRHNL